MLLNKEIFRSYDIRGVFGEFLTESLAECASRVFAGHVAEETGKNYPKISVGRDIRFSSITLFNGVVRGLKMGGADVVILGECPSPLTYFSCHCSDVDGYIMITGSHNPPQFNGLKVGTKNTVYHSEKITRIYDDIKAENYPKPKREGTETSLDIISAYKNWIFDNFAPLKIRISSLNRRIKIVLDCGSGTASNIAPEIFGWLGVDVLPLYCTPDGNFPGHHPDPTVEKNMSEAKSLMFDNNADMCIGYDGDADRLGALDNTGRMIYGDDMICIFADAIAEKHQGKTVVADVKASQSLYEFIEAKGMKPVMYRSGHSMIKVRMKELNAVIGGEMSSHFFFADRYFGFDDGIYASIRLLEAYVDGLISGKFTCVADMSKDIPKYVNTPEIREAFPDDKKFGVINKIKEIFNDYMNNGKYSIVSITDIDGIRIQFENGWALVRASNTEPLLVTRYEAVNNEEMQKIQYIIKQELGKLK